jgi:hypothetical protein
LLERWPEEDSGSHLEGHRRAELRSLGRHFSARRRNRSTGRTAASTGRYWMVRSCIGWPCSCRSCRTAFFMPDSRRAQPAWKWQCLVHEAPRMVLLSAGERKGAVRCQIHIVQVTPPYDTSKKVSHPVWAKLLFASRFRAGAGPGAPPRPDGISPGPGAYRDGTTPGIAQKHSQLPPKCDPLLIGM